MKDIPAKNRLQGRLPQLLASLDIRELRKFDEFLHSPYHNKNERLRNFFGLLKKKHPNYDKLLKETIFKHIFPEKKKYQDALVRALASDLTKKLKKFMILEEFNTMDLQQEYLLLEALLNRNIVDAFARNWKRIQEENNQIPKGLDLYFYQYKFNEIAYRFTTMHDNRSTQTRLQEAADQLDKYYLTNKLSMAVFMLNRQEVINVPHQYYLLDDVLRLVKGEEKFQEPAIRLRYLTVLALRNLEDISHYEPWKTHLLQYQDEFPSYELKQFCQAIINYCIWKTTKGLPNFQRELFDWFKYMLGRNLLHSGTEHSQQFLSPHHYRNLISTALALNEYEWTKDFMLRYKEEVAPTYRENVFRYSKAYYHFSRSEFELAARALQEISFSGQEFIDFYYHLYYKTLLLQVTFELDQLELLTSTLNSMELYIRRSKQITTRFRSSYLNVVSVVRKLYNKKIGKTTLPADLVSHIKQLSPLVEKAWLLEKAKDI